LKASERSGAFTVLVHAHHVQAGARAFDWQASQAAMRTEPVVIGNFRIVVEPNALACIFGS
jgi:hypothetical protein